MAYPVKGFPAQQLSFTRKNKKWRKQCVDFGDSNTWLHHHLARKDIFAMEINYDLISGKIHMEDLRALLNPYNLDASERKPICVILSVVR